MRFLDHQSVLKILPDRAVDSHKGNFGKILMLCGSMGYTGAAALAAMGALRSGAGLVYLGVPESIYAIEAIKLTEAIVFPLPDDDGKFSAAAVKTILKRLPDMDAVLIGCGMGQSEGTMSVLQAVLENAACPVIVDADGINLLGAHMDILRDRRYPTILTPHAGEFRRIGGDSTLLRAEAAKRISQENNCIVCLKGHETIITDGKHTYCNPTGNPGMAVGGTGDVLAGIITSLCAQGIVPLQAAACGVYLHGAAGDMCAEKMGQYGLLPTDMLEVLPRLMK